MKKKELSNREREREKREEKFEIFSLGLYTSTYYPSSNFFFFFFENNFFLGIFGGFLFLGGFESDISTKIARPIY